MPRLISPARREAPPWLTGEGICGGACRGCSSKLLIYLESELDCRESRIGDGDVPKLGELHRLVGQYKKIHQVLRRNGVAKAQVVV